MTTGPLTVHLEIVPLADVEPARLLQFVAALAEEPRWFGGRGTPRPSRQWRSRLCHPAGVQGVAALVGDDLVGVARLSPLADGTLRLHLAVGAPWRRQGIGSRLVEAIRSTAAGDAGPTRLVAVSDHRSAAVRGIARHFGMTTVELGPAHYEFVTALAS